MDIGELLKNIDPLRLLAEYDEEDQSYVVYCVDTGAVATGNSPAEAQALIKRILENDIRIAFETNSLESLFHSNASPEVKIRWIEAKTANPNKVQTITLDVPDATQKRGVQSELRVGKTRHSSSAA